MNFLVKYLRAHFCKNVLMLSTLRSPILIKTNKSRDAFLSSIGNSYHVSIKIGDLRVDDLAYLTRSYRNWLLISYQTTLTQLPDNA